MLASIHVQSNLCQNEASLLIFVYTAENCSLRITLKSSDPDSGYSKTSFKAVMRNLAILLKADTRVEARQKYDLQSSGSSEI